MDDATKMATMGAIAAGLSKYPRSPVFRTPADEGLEFEDIFFQALDGVGLEGWFIPSTDKSSKKTVICNHFGGGNRYGYAGHIKPQSDSPYGGKEVNFIPKYAALAKNGYNVICYDMRNHGLSCDANGGFMMGGLKMYRDVVGSVRFARSFEKTKDNTISLHSLCMGCNSTLVAFKKCPEDMKDVKCFLAVNPLGGTVAASQAMNMVGITDADRLEKFDMCLRGVSGATIKSIDMQPYVGSVHCPTLLLTVPKDPTTTEADINELFQGLGTKDKKQQFINDSMRRYDAYDLYSKDPSEMLAWLQKFHA